MLESISIIGTGFVGLVTAVCFADRGFRVYASTHDVKKAEMINRGIAPFYEPKLQPLLKSALEKGFKCLTRIDRAVVATDLTFITVGTPSRPDGSIDLALIEASAREIGRALAEKDGYHLVVVKSTVVPGTTEGIVKPLVEEFSGKKAGEDFGLCMSPEFLREGNAVDDTFKTDRVVIGEYDERSGDLLEKVFKTFYGSECPPILRMNLPSAEMVKYASNAFLATKISFINEIANICERIGGLDVREIARGMGLDYRIGRHFLNAGLGFGGSCFPKDVKALISFSSGLGYEPSILKAVLNVNERQALRGVEMVKSLLGELRGKRIALLGLSFKPETSDIREAPSLKIIKYLLEEGAEVVAYDPAAIDEVKRILGEKISYAASPIECLKGSDCCMVVTEWDEFRKLTPEDFLANMRYPSLVDGRRIYDPEVFSKKLKFKAIGLSRP